MCEIDEIDDLEPFDLIISSMVQMLLNERLVEKFLHAKKWLKPGGRMFPTKRSIYVAPFTYIFLSEEQLSKTEFRLTCGVDVHHLPLPVSTHSGLLQP